MPSARTLLVIGASLAGAKAAEAARAAGHDGKVLLVGEEPHLPYERPPLSKDALRGDADFDASRVHDAGFYADNDIELITADPAVSLDADARQAVLESGRTIGFDTAVLTTGAVPRRLTLPGADLDGVRYLRTVDDSRALQDAIRRTG